MSTLDPEQLVEVAAHAVDVRAEMDVRVEDLGVLRQLCPHVVLELLDEALRAPKDVLHGVGVYGRQRVPGTRALVSRLGPVATAADGRIAGKRPL